MPIDITNKEEKQIALTGTQIEETLLQAHLSKDAIEKIEGLKASASEIDNSVMMIGNVKNFGATGDGVTNDSPFINACITFCANNNIKTVYVPDGTYNLLEGAEIDMPLRPLLGARPCLYIPSNITLRGESKEGTILKQNDSVVTSTSMIESRAESNIILENITLYGNRVNDDVFIKTEREGFDIKDNCKNVVVRNVHFENIENEAFDIDLNNPDEFYNLNEFQYKVLDCTFKDIGGNGIHNANFTIVERCHFDNCARKRYLGMKEGSFGTDGQGAIDHFGHMAVFKDSTFINCVRAVHKYGGFGTFPRTHTNILDNCKVSNCSFSIDEINEISMSMSCGVVSNLDYISSMPNITAYLIENNSVIERDPIINTTKTMLITKAKDSIFKGMSLELSGLAKNNYYLKNCIVDKTGNTEAFGAVYIAKSAIGINLDGNTIYQDGAYAAILPNLDSRGHKIINNTVHGGSHSIRASNQCIISNNFCEGSSSWGVTVDGDRNVVTSNITNRETRDLGTGNIIANNLQV